MKKVLSGLSGEALGQHPDLRTQRKPAPVKSPGRAPRREQGLSPSRIGLERIATVHMAYTVRRAKMVPKGPA